MKFSNSWIIKWLDRISGAAFLFLLLMLIIKLFSVGAPALSKSIRGYTVNDISIQARKGMPVTDINKNLFDKWFNPTVVVQPHNKALIHLRIREKSDLLSPVAILFQISYYAYYILLVLATLQFKWFFGNLSKDEVFVKDSVKRLYLSGIFFISIPVVKYIQADLFIATVNRLNDSEYSFSNNLSHFSWHTLLGVMLIVFSLIFKVGVQIKKENESFI